MILQVTCTAHDVTYNTCNLGTFAKLSSEINDMLLFDKFLKQPQHHLHSQSKIDLLDLEVVVYLHSYSYRLRTTFFVCFRNDTPLNYHK